MSAPRTAPETDPDPAPEADESPTPPENHHSPEAPQPSETRPSPTDRTDPAHPALPGTTHPDTATDVVRWAAFSCVLVPVVLVWYGTSLAGAAGAALGLAAVTGVCRVLLRQSERGAARATGTAPVAEGHTTHRGRHGRSGSGAHRGGRHPGSSTPVD